MSHYLISLWYPLELGTFLISEDPAPYFELFPTETWDFFIFLMTGSHKSLQTPNQSPNLIRKTKELAKHPPPSHPTVSRSKRRQTSPMIQPCPPKRLKPHFPQAARPKLKLCPDGKRAMAHAPSLSGPDLANSAQSTVKSTMTPSYTSVVLFPRSKNLYLNPSQRPTSPAPSPNICVPAMGRPCATLTNASDSHSWKN